MGNAEELKKMFDEYYGDGRSDVSPGRYQFETVEQWTARADEVAKYDYCFMDVVNAWDLVKYQSSWVRKLPSGGRLSSLWSLSSPWCLWPYGTIGFAPTRCTAPYPEVSQNSSTTSVASISHLYRGKRPLMCPPYAPSLTPNLVF